MEEQDRVEEETVVISEAVEKLNAELRARYGTVPDHPIVDVVQTIGERSQTYRILSISEPVLGQAENKIVVKRTKSNCKRCFGFGYQAALEPINPERPGQLVLYLCSCLKPFEEKKEDD